MHDMQQLQTTFYLTEDDGRHFELTVSPQEKSVLQKYAPSQAGAENLPPEEVVYTKLLYKLMFYGFQYLGGGKRFAGVQMHPKQIESAAFLYVLHLTGRRYTLPDDEQLVMHRLSTHVDHRSAFVRSSTWVLSNKTGSGKTVVITAMLYLMSVLDLPEEPDKRGHSEQQDEMECKGRHSQNQKLHVVISCSVSGSVIGQWLECLKKVFDESRVVFLKDVTYFKKWLNSKMDPGATESHRQEQWNQHFASHTLFFVVPPKNVNVIVQLSRLLALGHRYVLPNGNMGSDIGPLLDTNGFQYQASVVLVLDEMKKNHVLKNYHFDVRTMLVASGTPGDIRYMGCKSDNILNSLKKCGVYPDLQVNFMTSIPASEVITYHMKYQASKMGDLMDSLGFGMIASAADAGVLFSKLHELLKGGLTYPDLLKEQHTKKVREINIHFATEDKNNSDEHKQALAAANEEYDIKKKNMLEAMKDTCFICLEDVDERKALVSKCGHVGHGHPCWSNWMKVGVQNRITDCFTCPYCRETLKPDDLYQYKKTEEEDTKDEEEEEKTDLSKIGALKRLVALECTEHNNHHLVVYCTFEKTGEEVVESKLAGVKVVFKNSEREIVTFSLSGSIKKRSELFQSFLSKPAFGKVHLLLLSGNDTTGLDGLQNLNALVVLQPEQYTENDRMQIIGRFNRLGRNHLDVPIRLYEMRKTSGFVPIGPQKFSTLRDINL